VTTWREIRDLRAVPPGYAGSDDQRRQVFGAALQQAEELASASGDVGYATRPILLFYALCQGFRAACASRLEHDWERSGHGLKFVADARSLLDSTVAPMPGRTDLYAGAMALAEETALPGKVRIGEVLATLFELRDLDIAGHEWPRPLIFRLPHRDADLADPNAPAPAPAITVLVDGFENGLSREKLQSALNAYPTLHGGEPASYPTGIESRLLEEEEERNGVAYRRTTFPLTLFPVFRFPFQGTTVADYMERYEELAPGSIEDSPNVRAVQPGVGVGSWRLGPITPWWMLLLGLSSLARYYPSQWRNALDIDREPLAPSLERVIDCAESAIPFYIFHALTATE
jgi:hypothetical protein